MSGIENIINKILEQAKAEAENILKEAEKYKKEKITEAEEQGKRLLDKTIQELEIKEKSEINKAKSAALLKNKQIVLKAKEKIISETFKIANEEISKRINSNEYPKILTRFIEEGAIALNGGELILQLPTQHQKVDIDLKTIADKVKEQTGNATTIKVDKTTIRSIGGIIIKNKDETKWVDNTIEERFNRFDKTIRTKINSILFE